MVSGWRASAAWQAWRGNPEPSQRIWAARLADIADFPFRDVRLDFLPRCQPRQGMEILGQIASGHYSFDNTTGSFLMVLGVGIAAHYAPKDWYSRCLDWFTRSPAWVQAGALALLVLSIQYVASTGAAPFVYTKF